MSVTLNPNRFTSTENRNLFTGAKVNTGKVLTGTSSHEDFTPEDSINVTISVFFDGTLNNRYNARAGKAHRNKRAGKEYDAKVLDHFIADSDEDTSFYNDESNVSKLEEQYISKNEEQNKQVSIYIDGIGTEAFDEDSTFGYALGQGPTGIKGKVEIACSQAANEIIQAAEGTDSGKINTLTIDAFGFSRGAAAARHFIAELYLNKGDVKAIYGNSHSAPTVIYYEVDGGMIGELMDNAGVKVTRLVVRHVGLFDTVTSLGVPWFHEMNDRSLRLDQVKKAKSVVQLTAADEHRSNFSLTNINKAVNSGVGIQIELPGVHSDIGGGYIDGAPEKVKIQTSGWLSKLEIEKQRLINQGWYHDSQMKIDDFWGVLWGTKDSVSNKYSFIPLQMMCRFSVEKGKVDFKKNKLNNKYRISGSDILTLAKMELDKYAFNNGSPLRYETYTPLIKELRNKFFHFSAHYKGFASPMSPNIENGQRIRKIFEG